MLLIMNQSITVINGSFLAVTADGKKCLRRETFGNAVALFPAQVESAVFRH